MHSSTLPFAVPFPTDLPCAFDLGALAAHFTTLVDQRDPRGVRYPLAPLLALAVCAKLAGHSRITALAEWARLRADDLAASVSGLLSLLARSAMAAIRR